MACPWPASCWAVLCECLEFLHEASYKYAGWFGNDSFLNCGVSDQQQTWHQNGNHEALWFFSTQSFVLLDLEPTFVIPPLFYKKNSTVTKWENLVIASPFFNLRTDLKAEYVLGGPQIICIEEGFSLTMWSEHQILCGLYNWVLTYYDKAR